MLKMCDYGAASFRRLGYVCAAIDYRLGKKNFRFDFDGIVRNCYSAVQDTRLAIAYFKANAARLRIDSTRIILGGNSAGGMMALQTGLCQRRGVVEINRQPGFRGATHTIEPGDIAAIINFWGGIFQPDWLRNARVPIVSVHGRLDNIVPYDHIGAFALWQRGDSPDGRFAPYSQSAENL